MVNGLAGQCNEGLRFLPLIDSRMRDANASFAIAFALQSYSVLQTAQCFYLVAPLPPERSIILNKLVNFRHTSRDKELICKKVHNCHCIHSAHHSCASLPTPSPKAMCLNAQMARILDVDLLDPH
ncbi:uncharacterized protein LOC127565421 [Drosophila albomicans]|uniref:Uncharacterized protein LOC127565421 n=1 Tax=Drosophila albomicans TaxID=7291 RepID=A0A9C6WE28_DROAB|nr:uncharacterized protein LOC127565421 [Drosophila albomicans]